MWDVVIADPRNADSMRTARIPKFVVVIFAIIAFVGIAGFGRLVYMVSNYALALYEVSDARRENNSLRQKMVSLERFIGQETDAISQFATYEDNARLKYGMNAIPVDVRKAGVGGFPSPDDILYASMLDPLIVKAESLRLLATALSHQAELQESTFIQVADAVQKKHNSWAERPAIWPTNGRLTSSYGYRVHPFTGQRLLHEGLDIANNLWTPVYAPANGRVKDINVYGYYGNTIRITHNNGEFVTLYAHLQKAAVTPGQAVKRGDLIAYMGNSGRSTGTHLHYEVHHNDRVVDPLAFIVAVDQIVDSRGRATSMPNTINMLLDVNIPIAVQLGQTKMNVRELLAMKKGQVVKLNRMAGEPVDVFIRKKMLAKGEITVVDDKLSVRISQLYSAREKFKHL
jgi:flagellar motor switch protein FliN